MERCVRRDDDGGEGLSFQPNISGHILYVRYMHLSRTGEEEFIVCFERASSCYGMVWWWYHHYTRIIFHLSRQQCKYGAQRKAKTGNLLFVNTGFVKILQHL